MTDQTRALTALVEQSLARHGVPGASVALLERGRQTVAASGIANVSTGASMTPDTVLLIGSITKLMTTTLVMQLVDEGLVNLDEGVAHYLPLMRLKDPDALRRITVRMLLNHTSGIDGELLPDHGHDEETIEKGVERFAQLGQTFPPGTDFSYCNAGMVIAGYLAQAVRRQSWYRLIRERIFEPLGMHHSATLPEEAILHNTSVGHYVSRGSSGLVTRTSRAFLPLSFAPCGTTLMTSAADLMAFANLHMRQRHDEAAGKILSEESVRAMQTIGVRHDGKGYTYGDGMGLGWLVFDNGLLHHSGGGPGIAAALYVHPAREWAIAILTNGDYGVSMDLINDIAQPWLKELGVKPYGAVDIQFQSDKVKWDPAPYVGIYQDILHRFTVSQTPSGLGLSIELRFATYENTPKHASPMTPLVPLKEGGFLLESSDGDTSGAGLLYRIYTFRNPDSNGRPQHLGNGLRLFRRVG